MVASRCMIFGLEYWQSRRPRKMLDENSVCCDKKFRALQFLLGILGGIGAGPSCGESVSASNLRGG